MMNMIKLHKWNEGVEVNQHLSSRFYNVNPGFIVEIEELPPVKEMNYSSRTRIVTALPGLPANGVLVIETAEQISDLATALFQKQKERAKELKAMNSNKPNTDREES
jgi:hypothetical protein